MKETRSELEKILSEIEGGQTTSANNSGMSMDTVMERLLGRPSEYAVAKESGEVPTGAEPAAQHLRYVNGAIPQAKEELFQVNQVDLWQVPVNGSLKSGNPILAFIKKVIRALIRPVITPIVNKQNEFNATAVRTMNGLMNCIICNSEQFDRQQDQYLAEIRRLNEEIRQLRDGKGSVYDVIDYDMFEKHFRGAEEEIRKRQLEYMPYLEKKHKVIDLGCGRGEFLELLEEKGIPATGVELFGKFVNECRLKGLDVQQMDAIEYMEMLEDSSVDGVVAFQLIEHLTPKQLVKLCKAAHDKLISGGTLIFETPNPTCLSVYTNAFYMDMTHEKPVHPQTIKYLLENAGFSDVEIVYTEASKVNYRLPLLELPGVSRLEEYNDAINGMTDLIWGSQDYAVIATK